MSTYSILRAVEVSARLKAITDEFKSKLGELATSYTDAGRSSVINTTFKSIYERAKTFDEDIASIITRTVNDAEYEKQVSQLRGGPRL